MAATIGVYTVAGHAETDSGPLQNVKRRRRVNWEAGRALEILIHAIEYLADEYIHDVKQISADDPRMEAIQLLMALNREVYFE